MRREAIELLLRDLRETLLEETPQAARAALRRISIFEMMYDYEEEPPVSNTAKVLLLEAGGEVYVIDEYHPHDYGRVHIRFADGSGVYGHYHKDEQTLEYRKVCAEVTRILYEADEWPADIKPGYHDILRYFGVSNE